MVKFDQISKKRKLFFRISKFGFFLSIIIALGSLIIEGMTNIDFYPKFVGICAIAMIFFGLIIRFPFKKHRIIGYIGFTKELIEIETLKKGEKINVTDLISLDFHIHGYNLQPIYFNNIYPFSNGTSNFVVIQTSKMTRTIEFYLDSKMDMKNLEKIADYYENRIKVNIDKWPKANKRYKAWRVIWNG